MNSSTGNDTTVVWHRLSSAQASRWFLYRLDPENRGLHNIALSAKVNGEIDVDALARALQRAIIRHPMLSVRFRQNNGIPEQALDPAAQVQVEVVDATGLGDASLRASMQDTCHRPFELEQAPRFRACVYRRDAADSIESFLLIVFDHIAVDGWSFWKICEEIGKSMSSGPGPDEEKLPGGASYFDYVQWQREWLESDAAESHWRYWQQYLGTELPVLQLPADRSRATAGPTRRIATFIRVMDGAQTARVNELARTNQCTAASVLLAAYQLMLHRCSGQDAIAVGCAVPGRSKAAWLPVAGDFVNPLPLVGRFSRGMTVAQLLRQARDSFFRGLDHQNFPFAEMVERLHLSRADGVAPLFQTSFIYQKTRSETDLAALLSMDADADPIHWGGLELRPSLLQKSNGARGLSDLSLEVTEMGGRLHCEFWYDENLFELATMQRLANHLVTLLDAMSFAPSLPVDELPLLSTEERHAILDGFNNTEAPYPADKLIHQLFEEQAARSPDAPAVVFEQHRLTYAELNNQANRLAHHLIRIGVLPDDRVAICVERSIDMVVGLLAILKAGAAYVPLDPTYPAGRLAYMLDDAAPKALITQSPLTPSMPTHDLPMVMIDNAEAIAALAGCPASNPAIVNLSSSNLAYIIYTSGSTGRPKGVMIEHRGLCNLALAQIDCFGIRADSRLLQFASFSFDASVSEIMTALCAGAVLCLASRSDLLPGTPLLQTLIGKGITHVTLPASALAAWHDETVLEPMTLVLAGEALPAPLARRWGTRHRVINAYGPTETTVCASAYPCNGEEADSVPIGRPIANMRVYILDEKQQPVPIGVTGELVIGGAGVARGYLNRPELTAERFLADPFCGKPDATMYRTGDLARWKPDGNIEYQGRNDFQVKLRGFRIELGEIESCLLAIDGMKEAAVIAREDAPGDKKLVAYVAGRTGVALSPAALRKALSASLAEYMVPSAFVLLDGLPLTPNGKLDRRALPAPDASAVIARTYEAPQGETELLVAAIWSELLGIERVGRHDHFFELGGHSLIAVTLIDRLHSAGLHLNVRNLFASPVLAELAAAAEQGERPECGVAPANLITENCQAITPDMLPLVELTQQEIDLITAGVAGGVANIQDIYPLSPLQEGILFHHLLEQEMDAYVLRSFLSFDSRQRLDDFLGALQGVIARHDILRTCMPWKGLAKPVQVVCRQAHLCIEEKTLADTGLAHQELQYQLVSREQRLDLERAPLMEAHIAANPKSGNTGGQADNEWLLVLLMHHVTTDHLALELIVNEVKAMLEGADSCLPEPVPYRDFIARVQSTPSTHHEAYFRRRLADVDEPTAPFGILDVQGNGSKVEETSLEFDAALSLRIREQARRHGVSAAVLFHVAFAQVLARCTGREDVVFGTVLLGRLQGTAGADRAMGLYMNTLPLRVSLGQRSVSIVVRETHENLHELLEHEYAPLSLAQRASGIASPLPLIAALFNYRHSKTVAQNSRTAWSGVRLLGAEERTNYPLTLSVDDLDQGFVASAMCVSGISAARMLHYLATSASSLVQALETGGGMASHGIDAMPAEERHRLLGEFNQAAPNYGGESLIHRLFETQAAGNPDAPALTFEEHSLSYGELNRRANRLAHRLIAMGVSPGDRVAICVERSMEIVVGLLAILKAGAGYVPLDPAYPSDRLSYMLEDSQPVALLTQAALAGILPKHELATVLVDEACLSSSSSDEADTCNPDVASLSSSSLAYVIYTSGSTGRPKGVMVEHGNVSRLFLATDHWFGFGAADVWTLFHSFAFDFSVWEIWGALLYGGRLVIVPSHCARSPRDFYALLCREGVTVLNQTPSAFRPLIAAEAAEPADGLHHALRHVIFGGEALELPTLAPWVSRNDPQRTRLVNMYGITEITVHATYRVITAQDIAASRGSVIGRAIPDLQMHIMDGHGRLMPIGVAGEIYVGGAGVARGYLNRPELNAERFIKDPFSNAPDARLYKTGDLGRWLPDGDIEYLGRNDFQVKIRGFRIELGEIEAKLLACAGVGDAVVIAREDAPGDKRLVAYLVARRGMPLSLAGIRTELGRTLAEHMVPGAYVVMDVLPLTTNGKLDRRALPAPDQTSVLRREFEAPQGEAEALIAVIWQDLLQLDQVGRHDHFFELGGHSLMVIGFIERLRQKGFTASVRAVFTAPVLSAFARQIVAVSMQAPVFDVPANQIGAGCRRITPELLPLVALSQEEVDGIVGLVDGGAANVQDIYPLTPLQEGMLFHHLLEQEDDAYLTRSMLAFDSRANLDAFLAALQTVIDRHDILRTGFHWNGLENPVQVVQRQATLPFTEHEAPGANALELLAAKTNPRLVQLDLRHAPLVAAHAMFDPDAGNWLLAVLDHHLISDNYSLQLMLAEIGELLKDGHAPGRTRLPAPLPYRNFVALMRTQPESAHESFFRELLADFNEPTVIFAPMPSEIGNGMQAEQETLRSVLDPALSARIREGARRHGVSAALLFHCAWALVLAKCSGKEDVVFGTVLSGRLQGMEGVERALGIFINTLPLRISLVGRNMRDAVNETFRQMSLLLEHEHAPLHLAQRCSAVPVSVPLFASILNYRHGSLVAGEDISNLDLGGARLISVEERTNYPVAIGIDDLGEDFALTVNCAQSIGAARLQKIILAAMSSMLMAIEEESAAPAASLTMLPEQELRLVLSDFNATGGAYPAEKTIHQLFEERVALHPESSAVIFEGETVTYRELDSRANCLAHRLTGMGVGPGDRVAICIERSVEMVAGLLGILKAGAAYVPLDPAYPVERLAFLLEDSSPSALLTQNHIATRLPGHAVPLLFVDDAASSAPETFDSIPPTTGRVSSSSLAYVIYTSGSTGKPKGVMIEHRSAVNLWNALGKTVFEDCTAPARVALNASISFDASLQGILQLLSGHCLVLVPQPARADGEALLGYLDEHQVEIIDCTPAQLEHLMLPGLGKARALKKIMVGGDAISPSLWNKLKGLPVDFYNVYGPTECTVDTTIEKIDGSSHAPTIGRPLSNTQVYILDTYRQPVPAGVPGEIYIGGAGVARGYLARPELTAERFFTDPFCSDPHARMYRTGDLGRWCADGRIEYQGRNDFQVKIRGFRIEPGEIETRLQACHGVKEAVVLAREDVPGDKRLVAYLVAAGDATLSPIALRAELAASLADYMVPSAFVVLARLPLTPNGKLDRKALPAPDASAVNSEAYEAPVGETETAIAAIWQDLLGINRIGRHDHFFQLGGHSLLAVRLVSRLRQTLGAELSLRELFAKPTLAALAALVEGLVHADIEPIAAVARTGAMPLSWMQQRLWFLNQLDGAAGVAYHMPGALRLRGRLSLAALRSALDAIVNRHESLRTSFGQRDGQPVQVIHAPSPFALAEQDLAALPLSLREAALEQAISSFLATPFDLSASPLIRGLLIRMADEEHVLAVNQHHIISDGWSIGILVRELGALYEAFLHGSTASLPPLPIQYADFAVWQRERLQGQALAAQTAFWRAHLQGAPALLELPTDRPRPAVQNYAGSTIPVTLSPELSRRLREFSRAHDATLFMTLLVGWTILLSRLSGQHDIVVGTPVANRQRAEVEPLIGFFVNTLALRTTLAQRATVSDVLAQVKTTLLSAYAHQDLPFEHVVEVVQPARSLSHSPLFQAMLSLNNTPAQELSLPELTAAPQPLPHATTHFDLSLLLAEDGAGIAGVIEYATDLFDAATIERWAGHLTVLFEAMTAAPQSDVVALPLLTQDDRSLILQGFNDTAVSYPSDRLVHHWFEEQVAHSPEAVALVFEDRSLSYGELNRRANQLAHHLIDRGVVPDDRVAICVERSIEMVVGLLAILKAGAAYVPLDPAYPAERLAYMLEDAAPVALITQSALEDVLPAHGVPIIVPDGAVDAVALVAHSASNPVIAGLSTSSLAYVIYTSGSTGRPKGVMIEHGGLMNYLQWAQAAYVGSHGADAVVSSPIAFDATITSLYLPLISGGKVSLVRNGDELAALERIVRAPQTSGIVKITPAHLKVLGQSLQASQSASLQGCTPQVFVIGGEALPAATALLWKALCPQARLINEYGPTETVVGCIIHEVGEPAELQGKADVPIGRPIANTQIHILDPQRRPVPIGVTGEIHIGGAGVARGYLNRVELTQERFLADPFSDRQGARLYKTGDLARWRADGTIEYLGRNDFQVKIRGFRIELGEVEASLMAIAGVREAAVLAREDLPGDKRLVAYLVAHQGAVLVPAELRATLAVTLAEYMVPSAFVVLDALPLTPNGKLDRAALPHPGQAATMARAYAAPQGEVEMAIAGAWQELMGLERVGRHDHFFELGGHSLMIVAFIERMRQRGWSPAIRTVFTKPVLHELAASIADCLGGTVASHTTVRSGIPENCTTITPDMVPLAPLSQAQINTIASGIPGGAANIQDLYPLSPLQQGILFHHMASPEDDVYLQCPTMAFDSRTQLDGFLRALREVISRHDVLRTSFRWEGLPQLMQVVCREVQLPVHEVAMARVLNPVLDHGADPARQLEQHARSQKLDLRLAPPLAAYIARDPGSEEWLLALLTHHISIDHVSLANMVGEIQILQNAEHGKSTALLPQPVPYRDLISRISGMPSEEHEAYFRRRLADIDEPTAPFGILDVSGSGSLVEEARQTLDAALSLRIREQARHQGVSAAVLFHVAFAQVLARCTGRDDVVFGTVLLGRMQGTAGADRAVGLYMNTLPLRVTLGELRASDAVRSTHESLLELLEHEHAPLSLAQRSSGVVPPLPLFSTLLNYRHSTDAESADAAWDGMRLLHAEERTNYPLTLSIDELSQTFAISALCCAGMPAQRMAAYVAAAIATLVDLLEADANLHSADFLPAAERHRVVSTFNSSTLDIPKQATIHGMVEDQAARTPELTAVEFNGSRLSYRELDKRANKLAHYMRAQGVGPDKAVGICVERSMEMVVGLLATLKAGSAYVPLDPAYPAERLAYMLEESAPAMLLSLESLKDALPAHGVPTLFLDSGWDALAGYPETTPENLTVPDNLAYIIYTSGSTGRPKGVSLPVGALVAMLAWQLADRKGRRTHDEAPVKTLQFASLNFDVSFQEIFSALCAGDELVLIDEDMRRDLDRLRRFIIESGFGRVYLPNAVLQQMAGLSQLDKQPVRSHTACEIVTAGEQLFVNASLISLVRQFGAKFLHNQYGPSETHVATQFTLDADDMEHWPQAPCIGSPIANTHIYILDAHRHPVPVGVAGEIFIGGAGVARGYLNRPDLTDERFLPDPFAAGANARMYRTGDLGRWLDDGTIAYLGRNDFQVKIRGFRVELGEIESQLFCCKGVREAVVISREDTPGDRRLAAYVVARDGASLSAMALREELGASLAEHMVPSAFVVLASLPLTPNGKLDRRALPAPDMTALASRPFEAPESEAEIAVAQIWQELLHADKIGRDDHFFELGGHSLLAVQLTVRLRDAFQVDVPVTAVFQNPQLAGFAAVVRSLQMKIFLGEELESMQAELDGLSEEELMALLAKEDASNG